MNTRMCELEAIPDHIDNFASVATNENTALRRAQQSDAGQAENIAGRIHAQTSAA